MKIRKLFIGIFLGVVLVLMLALLLDHHPQVFSPASAPLEVIPDWIANGEEQDNHFGYSVTKAGDVNGDGYSDIVIGADRYKQFTGRVYVYLGSSEGLSATPAFTATGEGVNNHFGYAVDSAGDVNGDGYDDIIVDAYHNNGFTGRVYVYAGGPKGLSANPIFTATGEGRNTYFGRSVGAAGDVNGDGYDDVIVGAQGYGNWAGKIYVFAGCPAGLDATPIFTATGESSSDSFGRSIGTVGDLNGDGYADVVIGAPSYADFTGRIYIYTGSTDGLSNHLTLTITGEEVKDQFGYSVGTAGDVNKDGYDDLIIGADGYGNNSGRIYVYTGSINGLNSTPIFTITGEAENNHFGYAVSTSGDMNGDGNADIIVGAYQYNGSTGRVYAYPGTTSGLGSSPILIATGEDPASSFGRSVGTAGDVNGDGYDDIIVGALAYNHWTGRVYVYFGKIDHTLWQLNIQGLFSR